MYQSWWRYSHLDNCGSGFLSNSQIWLPDFFLPKLFFETKLNKWGGGAFENALHRLKFCISSFSTAYLYHYSNVYVWRIKFELISQIDLFDYSCPEEKTQFFPRLDSFRISIYSRADMDQGYVAWMGNACKFAYDLILIAGVLACTDLLHTFYWSRDVAQNSLSKTTFNYIKI